MLGYLGRLCFLLIFSAMTIRAVAQSSAQAKSGPTTGASAPSEENQSALGFSIESEMLSYRALESNSEAIACDIVAYMDGGSADFNHPTSGAVCRAHPDSNANVRVVIAPFDSSAFDEFHLWRANMEVVREFRTDAASIPTSAKPYCPQLTPAPANESTEPLPSPGASPLSRGGAGLDGESTSSATVALAAFEPALAMAEGALGLFKSVTTNSSVGGTIQDQALMNAVGRQLRALNVVVLMPFTYSPNSLTTTDAGRSPFLSSLTKLLEARACLSNQRAKSGTSAEDKALIDRLNQDIDKYLAGLRGLSQTLSDSPKAGEHSPDNNAPTSPDNSAPTSPAKSVTPPPIVAVLAGDGLALKIGVKPETGLNPDATSHHVLLLKALESGGTAARKENILASKSLYSGGSIATYALFTLDGDLECSGDVFEYGGQIAGEKFQLELRQYIPDPAQQFLFQRGTCRAPRDH